MNYLLALDQGTSSSRSIIFDDQGRMVSMAQQEIKQYYPQSGWVEHDPEEIWQSQYATACQVLQQSGIAPAQIKGVGITNQRETTIVWRRDTGQPIYPAIVWQDRRGEADCQSLREAGHEALFRQKTGLVLDAYFSATKLKWLLDHVPRAREQAERGELAFGTVDAWLLWRLTKGQVHATDVSNASRTLMFNVKSQAWDDELLDLLRIPRALLPQVYPSSHLYGQVHTDHWGSPLAIGGIAGDQQSALFGQTCFYPGLAKNTYGTGCFLLMHTGQQFLASQHGLLTTSTAQVHSTPEFALEGSVFIGGAVVQWLRDGLGAIKNSHEIQALAQSVPDSGGVMMVPAFTGLGAPYWNPNARGAILGLSRGTTMAHIARAAVESIAFQSAALLHAMNQDVAQAGGVAMTELRVDGGACVNDMLMQFQADLLGIPVVRPAVIETTALGAAYLAGLSTGVFENLQVLRQHWRIDRAFQPTMPRDQSHELMAQWHHAIHQTTLTPAAGA